jgi:hypothetical protein
MAIIIASPASGSVIAWGSVQLRRTKIVELEIVLEEDGVAVPAAGYTVTLETGGTGSFVELAVLGWTASGANTIVSGTVNVGSATALADRTLKAYVSFREDVLPGTIQDASVHVRVFASGSTTAAFDITLTFQATAVATVNPSMVMVLDRSGSMSTVVTGSLTRTALLRAAGSRCVQLMEDNDQLGIVTFNQDPTDTMTLGALGALGAGGKRDDALAIFADTSSGSALNPSGSTSIGDGLFNADAMLGAFTDRNIVVLTDGIENTSRFLTDVSGIVAGTDIYAIGLGDYSGVDSNLNSVTATTGKYLLITGDLTGDQQFKLDKYFYQILLDVKKSSIVLDPEAVLTAGTEHFWPFKVSEVDHGFEAVVFTNSPELIDFDLVLPNGQVLDSSLASLVPGGSFTVGKGILFFRFKRRMPAGTWKARLRFRGKYDDRLLKEAMSRLGDHRFEATIAANMAKDGVRYAFVAATPSDLTFDTSLQATGVNVGASFLLSATILEASVGVAGRASVNARVTLPDGSTLTVPLPELQPGRFAASMPTFLPGQYQVTFLASGKTLRGTPFTRESTRTGALFPAGQQPPKAPGAADPGTDPTGGRPGGGTGTGTGGSGPLGTYDPYGVEGALEEIAKKFPELARVLKQCLLCCRERQGHCHSHCDCSCHRK